MSGVWDMALTLAAMMALILLAIRFLRTRSEFKQEEKKIREDLESYRNTEREGNS